MHYHLVRISQSNLKQMKVGYSNCPNNLSSENIIGKLLINSYAISLQTPGDKIMQAFL